MAFTVTHHPQTQDGEPATTWYVTVNTQHRFRESPPVAFKLHATYGSGVKVYSLLPKPLSRRGIALRTMFATCRHYFSPQEWWSGQYAYGGREIVSKFAGMPSNMYLVGNLQHAWSVDVDPWLTATLSPLGGKAWSWIWEKGHAEEARRNGVRRIAAVGAPWLYMRQLSGRPLHVEEIKSSRTGRVLFVPTHHYPNPALWQLHRHYANKLAAEFGGEKVVVLLSAGDFLQRTVRLTYEHQGIRVETAGIPGWALRHPNNAYWNVGGDRTEFLFNIADLMDSADLMVTNGVGTHVFYAASSGLPVLSWALSASERDFYPVQAWTSRDTRKAFQYQDEVLRMMPDQFVNPDILSEESRRKLGLDSLMSPDELRSHLVWRPIVGGGHIPSIDEARIQH